MKTETVNAILRTCDGDTLLDHTIDINTTITFAIEQMIKNNVREIVVLRNGKPAGKIHLNDALERLGLKVNKS